MPESLELRVDGRALSVLAGSTVAAAVLRSGKWACRRSVSGEPRGALCGMGICGECRVTIDGRRHQRSCQIICRAGMEITTGD